MPHITIDGVAWYYEVTGPKGCTDAPLLLFCHSTFSDHRLFDDLIAALSHDWRCVALDWPGHGRSGWRADGWTMDDLVHGVPQLLTALGVRSAILLGVSLGAAVALRTALAYPERVRALVYMSARAEPHVPALLQNMTAMAAALSEASDETRRTIWSSEFFETLLHRPGWRADHPEAAARELAIQMDVPRAALPLIAAVLPTMGPTRHRLHEIACPVLSLFGTHDPGVQWAEVVGHGVQRGTVRIIENAGHHLPFDAPDETLAAIQEFLHDLTPSRLPDPSAAAP